jgi:hypothetical protein
MPQFKDHQVPKCCVLKGSLIRLMGLHEIFKSFLSEIPAMEAPRAQDELVH